MQKNSLFAATGALGAACLALLGRADPALGRINSVPANRLELTAVRLSTQRRDLIALRAPVLPELVHSVSAANQFFISQYHSRFNPAASDANANCGPVCLAMALKRFYGTQMGGTDAGQLVTMAREAMTGNSDPDENTDNNDVLRGAGALGLFARRVLDLETINAALDSGAMAVVSGSPAVPGSFGSRLAYHHCHSGHFIVVAGRVGDHYFMCDPESPNGTTAISRSELAAFLTYWPPERQSLHGAIALWPTGSFTQSSIAEFGSGNM